MAVSSWHAYTVQSNQPRSYHISTDVNIHVWLKDAFYKLRCAEYLQSSFPNIDTKGNDDNAQEADYS